MGLLFNNGKFTPTFNLFGTNNTSSPINPTGMQTSVVFSRKPNGTFTAVNMPRDPLETDELYSKRIKSAGLYTLDEVAAANQQSFENLVGLQHARLTLMGHPNNASTLAAARQMVALSTHEVKGQDGNSTYVYDNEGQANRLLLLNFADYAYNIFGGKTRDGESKTGFFADYKKAIVDTRSAFINLDKLANNELKSSDIPDFKDDYWNFLKETGQINKAESSDGNTIEYIYSEMLGRNVTKEDVLKDRSLDNLVGLQAVTTAFKYIKEFGTPELMREYLKAYLEDDFEKLQNILAYVLLTTGKLPEGLKKQATYGNQRDESRSFTGFGDRVVDFFEDGAHYYNDQISWNPATWVNAVPAAALSVAEGASWLFSKGEHGINWLGDFASDFTHNRGVSELEKTDLAGTMGDNFDNTLLARADREREERSQGYSEGIRQLPKLKQDEIINDVLEKSKNLSYEYKLETQGHGKTLIDPNNQQDRDKILNMAALYQQVVDDLGADAGALFILNFWKDDIENRYAWYENAGKVINNGAAYFASDILSMLAIAGNVFNPATYNLVFKSGLNYSDALLTDNFLMQYADRLSKTLAWDGKVQKAFLELNGSSSMLYESSKELGLVFSAKDFGDAVSLYGFTAGSMLASMGGSWAIKGLAKFSKGMVKLGAKNTLRGKLTRGIYDTKAKLGLTEARRERAAEVREALKTVLGDKRNYAALRTVNEEAARVASGIMHKGNLAVAAGLGMAEGGLEASSTYSEAYKRFTGSEVYNFEVESGQLNMQLELLANDNPLGDAVDNQRLLVELYMLDHAKELGILTVKQYDDKGNVVKETPVYNDLVYLSVKAKAALDIQKRLDLLNYALDTALDAACTNFMLNAAINGPIMIYGKELTMSHDMREATRSARNKMFNNENSMFRGLLVERNAAGQWEASLAARSRLLKVKDHWAFKAGKNAAAEGLEEYAQNISNQVSQSIWETDMNNYINTVINGHGHVSMIDNALSMLGAGLQEVGTAATSLEALKEAVMGTFSTLIGGVSPGHALSKAYLAYLEGKGVGSMAIEGLKGIYDGGILLAYTAGNQEAQVQQLAIDVVNSWLRNELSQQLLTHLGAAANFDEAFYNALVDGDAYDIRSNQLGLTIENLMMLKALLHTTFGKIYNQKMKELDHLASLIDDTHFEENGSYIPLSGVNNPIRELAATEQSRNYHGPSSIPVYDNYDTSSTSNVQGANTSYSNPQAQMDGENYDSDGVAKNLDYVSRVINEFRLANGEEAKGLTDKQIILIVSDNASKFLDISRKFSDAESRIELIFKHANIDELAKQSYIYAYLLSDLANQELQRLEEMYGNENIPFSDDTRLSMTAVASPYDELRRAFISQYRSEESAQALLSQLMTELSQLEENKKKESNRKAKKNIEERIKELKKKIKLTEQDIRGYLANSNDSHIIGNVSLLGNDSSDQDILDGVNGALANELNAVNRALALTGTDKENPEDVHHLMDALDKKMKTLTSYLNTRVGGAEVSLKRNDEGAKPYVYVSVAIKGENEEGETTSRVIENDPGARTNYTSKVSNQLLTLQDMFNMPFELVANIVSTRSTRNEEQRAVIDEYLSMVLKAFLENLEEGESKILSRADIIADLTDYTKWLTVRETYNHYLKQYADDPSFLNLLSNYHKQLGKKAILSRVYDDFSRMNDEETYQQYIDRVNSKIEELKGREGTQLDIQVLQEFKRNIPQVKEIEKTFNDIQTAMQWSQGKFMSLMMERVEGLELEYNLALAQLQLQEGLENQEAQEKPDFFKLAREEVGNRMISLLLILRSIALNNVLSIDLLKLVLQNKDTLQLALLAMNKEGENLINSELESHGLDALDFQDLNVVTALVTDLNAILDNYYTKRAAIKLQLETHVVTQSNNPVVASPRTENGTASPSTSPAAAAVARRPVASPSTDASEKRDAFSGVGSVEANTDVASSPIEELLISVKSPGEVEGELRDFLNEHGANEAVKSFNNREHSSGNPNDIVFIVSLDQTYANGTPVIFAAKRVSDSEGEYLQGVDGHVQILGVVNNEHSDGLNSLGKQTHSQLGTTGAKWGVLNIPPMSFTSLYDSHDVTDQEKDAPMPHAELYKATKEGTDNVDVEETNKNLHRWASLVVTNGAMELKQIDNGGVADGESMAKDIEKTWEVRESKGGFIVEQAKDERGNARSIFDYKVNYFDEGEKTIRQILTDESLSEEEKIDLLSKNSLFKQLFDTWGDQNDVIQKPENDRDTLNIYNLFLGDFIYLGKETIASAKVEVGKDRTELVLTNQLNDEEALRIALPEYDSSPLGDLERRKNALRMLLGIANLLPENPTGFTPFDYSNPLILISAIQYLQGSGRNDANLRLKITNIIAGAAEMGALRGYKADAVSRTMRLSNPFYREDAEPVAVGTTSVAGANRGMALGATFTVEGKDGAVAERTSGEVVEGSPATTPEANAEKHLTEGQRRAQAVVDRLIERTRAVTRDGKDADHYDIGKGSPSASTASRVTGVKNASMSVNPNDTTDADADSGNGIHQADAVTSSAHGTTLDKTTRSGLEILIDWSSDPKKGSVTIDDTEKLLDAILDSKDFLHYRQQGKNHLPNQSRDIGIEICRELIRFKLCLDAAGWTVIPRDINVALTIDVVNKAGEVVGALPVAGELDLLAYDRDGVFHVIDMKTMRNNFRYIEDNIPGWTFQTSSYVKGVQYGEEQSIPFGDTAIFCMGLNYLDPGAVDNLKIDEDGMTILRRVDGTEDQYEECNIYDLMSVPSFKYNDVYTQASGYSSIEKGENRDLSDYLYGIETLDNLLLYEGALSKEDKARMQAPGYNIYEKADDTSSPSTEGLSEEAEAPEVIAPTAMPSGETPAVAFAERPKNEETSVLAIARAEAEAAKVNGEEEGLAAPKGRSYTESSMSDDEIAEGLANMPDDYDSRRSDEEAHVTDFANRHFMSETAPKIRFITKVKNRIQNAFKNIKKAQQSAINSVIANAFFQGDVRHMKSILGIDNVTEINLPLVVKSLLDYYTSLIKKGLLLLQSTAAKQKYLPIVQEFLQGTRTEELMRTDLQDLGVSPLDIIELLEYYVSEDKDTARQNILKKLNDAKTFDSLLQQAELLAIQESLTHKKMLMLFLQDPNSMGLMMGKVRSVKESILNNNYELHTFNTNASIDSLLQSREGSYTASSLLRGIALRTKNLEFKRLALQLNDVILKNLLDIVIHAAEMPISVYGSGIEGQSKNFDILINKDILSDESRTLRVILHEVLHSVVRSDKEIVKKVEDIMSEAILEILRTTGRSEEDIRKSIYGFTNALEFISEYFTNAIFQLTLKNLGAEVGISVFLSMANAFKGAVKGQSIFSRALGLMENLLLASNAYTKEQVDKVKLINIYKPLTVKVPFSSLDEYQRKMINARGITEIEFNSMTSLEQEYVMECSR